MMSGVMIRLLLFLLPFILFLVWLGLVRRIGRGDGTVEPFVERLIVWGGGAFVFAFALGLFLYGKATMPVGDDESMRYVPAHMENGELVPGHYEKKPDG